MSKEISFTKVKAPKFKIGRFVLNEYEIRQIMAEVSEGKRQGNIKFKDNEGNTITIEDDGYCSDNVKGFELATDFTRRVMKANMPQMESKRKEYLKYQNKDEERKKTRIS